MHSVYRITNHSNGFIYVGGCKTNNLRKRKSAHFTSKGNSNLDEDLTITYRDAFQFEVLYTDIETLEQCKELEAELIVYHGCVCPHGYNSTIDGQLLSGENITEQTKVRMSTAHTGKELSEKHKRKLSIAKKGENNHFYGKKHSEESKTKMSVAHTGKPSNMKNKKHSEKSKIKMSRSKRHPVWKHYDEIIMMSGRGMSQRKIAKHFGCSKAPIENILKHHKRSP